MEKFRCKLCLRNFANGKALGGHKRSHMMNFAVKKQKKVQTFEMDSQPSDDFQLSSSTSEEEEVLCYELRENPQKSIRFVDPRFFFSSSSSVVLQERESAIFRRSKRVRKTRISVKETETMKKSMSEKGENTSNDVSDQPLSSVSDTPEEDVAHCLMMLSRDTWHREQYDYEEQEDRERNEYDDDDDDDDDSDDFGAVKVAKVGGKYRCETCNKVFRSYQALGGHRANHKKKIKVNITVETPPRAVVETGRNGGSIQVEEKIHECPICFRVFSSGQALGGHKRSHFIGGGAIPVNVNSITTTPPVVAEPFSRIGETLNFDLNLPAPVDDDEIGQIVNFS